MKAIGKDRGRRYETANAFAADTGRFLADEAVVAAKPSAGYKVHKFARRNKVALAVASTIAAVLVMATVVSSWQADRAFKAEKEVGLRLVEAEADSRRTTLCGGESA